MTTRTLRIAVSGPSGAGKSTLVQALSKKLDLPAITESMSAIYDARAELINSTKPPAAPAAQQYALRDKWMKTYFDWCEQRQHEYTAAQTGYVADRWELDLFGTWLRTFSPYQPASREILNEHAKALLERVKEQVMRVDLVVMLPVPDAGVADLNEVGLRRVNDYPSLLLSHANTLGLMQLVGPGVPLYAPVAVESVEKRISDIAAMIA